MGKRKIYLAVLLTLSIITSSLAQQTPISINFGAGYSFGTTQNSVETYVNSKLEGDTYYTENKKFSLGYGYSLDGSVMYLFHKNMGLGVGFSYHFPKEIDFNEVNEVAGIISEKMRLLSSKRFSLIPAFQVNTDFDKLNTFLKVGVSLNFTNQKLNETTTVDSTVTEYFWEYSGKSLVGYYTQWGLSYAFNERLSAILSVTYEGYSYTPDRNDLVLAKQNDVNISLNSIKEIDKAVVYEDWVSGQYNQYPDPNKPLSLPRQTFNYSSLTIGLALSYHF